MRDKQEVTIDAASLRTILEALVGQPHLIREIMATRRLNDNPITAMVEQFNAEIERINSPRPQDEAPSPVANVLEEVKAERVRQEAKWGEQNHPDYTPTDFIVGETVQTSRIAKHVVDTKAKSGRLSYYDILVEEIAEARDEAKAGNAVDLRTELVQCAAVAVAWIECIDRRGARNDR